MVRIGLFALQGEVGGAKLIGDLQYTWEHYQKY